MAFYCRAILGAFFQSLYFVLERAASVVLIVWALNIVYKAVLSNPDTGCALTSVVRDITCRNASHLMQPMTNGCDIYVSVRDVLCPTMFRTQWYL